MGSYISSKTRASSYGSSTGPSLVVSFFDDCLDAVSSNEARAYIETVKHGLRKGESPDLPPQDLCPTDFDLAYQCYNMCRKTRMHLWLPPRREEEMVEEAVKGFLDRESINRYMNQKGYIPGWSSYCSHPTVVPEQVIHLARLKLEGLLGDVFPLDEFAESVGFSSGSSTRLPRRRGAAPYKFQGKPHVTRQCALLALNLIWYHEPWRLYCQNRFGRESDPFSWLKIVEGSEYFTVPKTATTLRGAAKEAEMNMFCQKAIGNMIRRRLRRVGVDLRCQNRNQELAQYGSMTGELATIDLSAASDSISLRCLELLPGDWARFIRMTRSEKIKLPDGSWHVLEMVSSMGNGFTFELETAIFWSLASAARQLCAPSGGPIGIYGDDIIIPTGAAAVLVQTLGSLGFNTNASKSFLHGPFRESCGGHYFYGSDVTPFYLRDSLDKPDDRYLFMNSFNRWAWRHPRVPFKRTRRWCIKNKPRHVAYVHADYGLRQGLYVRSAGFAAGVHFCLRRQGYIHTVHQTRTEQVKVWGEHGYLAWFLQTDEVKVAHEEGRVRRYASRRVSSRWPDVLLRFGNLLDPLFE